MSSSLWFPIAGLFFSIMMILVLINKGSINTRETRTYKGLLFINFIGLILEIFCTYASIVYDTNHILSVFILKTYLVYNIVWVSLLTYYTFVITHLNIEDKLFYNVINKIFMFFILIASLFCYVLPINLVLLDGFRVRYTNGLSVSFTYAFCVILICYMFVCIIRNVQNLKNKKFIPVFTFLFIGIIGMIIQIYQPGILILTFIETFVTAIMYHTIENPDVKMIQQLEVARDAADKANRAKTDFLSSMSHEIRTPLNAIVGFSDCIMDAKDLGEAKANALDIVNASQTLLEIVNGILDISKIEAGKLEIVNSKYNAIETFEELAKLITPKMHEKGLDFTYKIAPDLPQTLYGDHANLKKIVTNLLSNACKYTEQGYVHYEVSCVNTGDVSKLIISVEDSGRGIKKDSIDKLFTKFQRLEEDRNTTIEGTGLGLAITKQLIELMGGKIIVHTVYGEGSKFTVVLNQKITASDNEVKHHVKTTLDLNNVRILIVDDTALNLKVATKLLEKYNANQIVTCDSGFECIDRIKRGEIYDLILLDDMMPKMSGVITLKKLKEISGFKIPTIALTANAITGMREKYLADGFDGYLAKPIEKEQLIQVINQILGRNVTEDLGALSSKLKKELPVCRDEVLTVESINEVEEERQTVIPVEDNIEEILGDSLDRNYSDNNSSINNNIEVFDAESNNTSASSIVPVMPINVDMVQGFKPTSQDLKSVNDTSYNAEYLKKNGVDLDHALELLGDMEMYNMTISDFVKGVSEKWNKIVDYKNNNDMPNYAIEVHSLKSDCKYLGFMTLANISYQHELKSKENDSEFVNSNFSELEAEYKKVLDIARTYVEHNPVTE